MELAIYMMKKTTREYGKEECMQAIEKIPECSCGMVAETYCAGCGEPLCSHCGSIEISSFDPKTIEVKYFCEKCKDDPAKNPWGKVYWEELAARY